MVLVFMRHFSHLDAKFGANTPMTSHFEQICFFARAGITVKWEKAAGTASFLGIKWEKPLKFNHFKLAPKVSKAIHRLLFPQKWALQTFPSSAVSQDLEIHSYRKINLTQCD